MASSSKSKKEKLADTVVALVNGAVSETGKAPSEKKLNNIHQKLVEIDKRLQQMTSVMEQEAKLRKIEFALHNVHRKSFDYQTFLWDYGENCEDSGSLVTEILWSFLKDCGYYLPTNGMIPRNDHNEEQARKEFRQSIVFQLESLLGSKPRLSKEKDGRYAVWYK